MNMVATYRVCEHSCNIECANRVAVCEQGGNIEREQGGNIVCEQGGNIKCVNRVAIYRVCEHGSNIECEQGGNI